MKNLFDVSGKVALVTGGSRGIGEMIAAGFVANGVKTYISARKADACDATAARLSEQGECISIPADLSTSAGIKALADEIKSREGQLDILVNNAGATWGAPIEEFPEAAWDKVMNINVKGPFFLTQALLPLRQQYGHVLLRPQQSGCPSPDAHAGISPCRSLYHSQCDCTRSVPEQNDGGR
jgi:NAD(P)-dependent dehydrogenase (short-subunit alcohol dehydrogenase family)